MKDDSSAVATSDQISERSRDVAWYHPQLTEVPPAAREILEQYSKIPASDIEKHVFDIVGNSRFHYAIATPAPPSPFAHERTP